MKRRIFRTLLLGSAVASLAGSLAVAQSASGATAVEGISVRQTDIGLALSLDTSGDSPQIVTATSGRTLQADIARAELQLPDGESFNQKDPAPGIESIQVEAIENGRVRLTVQGDEQAPIGEIQKSGDASSLLISLDARPGAKANPTPLPESLVTVPGEPADVENLLLKRLSL